MYVLTIMELHWKSITERHLETPQKRLEIKQLWVKEKSQEELENIFNGMKMKIQHIIIYAM